MPVNNDSINNISKIVRLTYSTTPPPNRAITQLNI